MSKSSQISLDPATLSAFAASLAALPQSEIRKAKSLFVRNAIADYKMMLKSTKGFLIVLGCLCIIPVFLVVFIPAFINYRAVRDNEKQKIVNALEVWKEDLEEEYELLLCEISPQ